VREVRGDSKSTRITHKRFHNGMSRKQTHARTHKRGREQCHTCGTKAMDKEQTKNFLAFPPIVALILFHHEVLLEILLVVLVVFFISDDALVLFSSETTTMSFDFSDFCMSLRQRQRASRNRNMKTSCDL